MFFLNTYTIPPPPRKKNCKMVTFCYYCTSTPYEHLVSAIWQDVDEFIGTHSAHDDIIHDYTNDS